MTKNEFSDILWEKGILWPYDQSKAHQLPESIIIEHTLLYGDVGELKLLFILFEQIDIRKVWEDKLAPQKRYHKLNTYLATFFFRIPETQKFLKNKIVDYPRLERFKLLIADD